jgi:beta-lactamase class A
MNRLGPINNGRFLLERMDLMLVAALSIVLASYALGYRLDWTEGQAWPEGDEAEAAAVAAPASAAPSRPQPQMLPRTTPTWSPDSRDEAWDSMTSELAATAARHPGRVAIYLRDLNNDRSWSYHPDDLFPSASLIKVPVMAAVFQKMQAGELSLNDRLTLRRRSRVGGSGSLKWRPDGSKLRVSELLRHMISESDNTATAMLLDAIGIGYAQRTFPNIGLLYTGIYPEGMSIKGGRVAHENYTTAREMSMLMENIYRGRLVGKEESRLMLDILRYPKATASRLAKGLPRGWVIAHKTGLLRRACHDSAIIFTPYGDYAITVLTGQNRNYHDAKEFISRLGRVTFKHYSGYAEPDRLARASKSRQIALR